MKTTISNALSHLALRPRGNAVRLFGMGAAIVTISLSSCSGNDPGPYVRPSAHTVPVSATVSVPGSNTRSTLEQNTSDGSLSWGWTVGDGTAGDAVIAVNRETGETLGRLYAKRYVSDADRATAVFEGQLTFPDADGELSVAFIHSGSGAAAAAGSGSYVLDLGSQTDTSFAGLAARDVLVSTGNCKVTYTPGYGIVDDFAMKHVTSIAHLGFELEGEEIAALSLRGSRLATKGTLDMKTEFAAGTNSVVPANTGGADAVISIAKEDCRDFHVTLLPTAADETTDMKIEFTTAKGNVYEGFLANPSDGSAADIAIPEGRYLRLDNECNAIRFAFTGERRYLLSMVANNPAGTTVTGLEPATVSRPFHEGIDGKIKLAIPEYESLSCGVNYSFLGWADEASATEEKYQSGHEFELTQSAPTLTIYGVWQIRQSELTVAYEVPDGVTAPESWHKTLDMGADGTEFNYTLADAVSHDKLVFKGWRLKDKPESEVLAGGAAATTVLGAGVESGTVVYVAVWESSSTTGSGPNVIPGYNPF